MRIGSVSLILAVLAPVAAAQETGAIEGRVVSSTDQNGIAGAVVTVGSQRANTDRSGGFRLAGLAPGDYRLVFEAAGFFPAGSKVHLGAGPASARTEVRLVPHSSLSGRVFDEDGNPLAGIVVEVTEDTRGTGTTWTVGGGRTDREGRYEAGPLHPGVYVVRARAGGRDQSVMPPKPREGEKRGWVSTYYPSTSSRSQAAGLVLTGGTHLSGCDIRLIAVPLYAIRGVVYDDAGEPVSAGVSVIGAERPVLETEARVQAHNGAFEIPGVPSGDWLLTAEAKRGGVTQKGAAAVTLSSRDLENAVIRLAPPFAYQALVEPRGKADAHVELDPVDVPPEAGYANEETDSDGVVWFPAVYPGRYRVNIFAEVEGFYLASVFLGDQEVLGKEVTLAEGSPPIRVVFKNDGGGIGGTVEDCGGGTVLALPEDEGLWDFRFIRWTECDLSGHFEIGGLRPGRYFAVALDRIDATGLDRLSTLRRLASRGTAVEIEANRVAQVELKVSSWPE